MWHLWAFNGSGWDYIGGYSDPGPMIDRIGQLGQVWSYFVKE